MADYISYALTAVGVGVTAYISRAGRRQTKQHHYVNLRTTIAQELAAAQSREGLSDPTYLEYLLSEYSKKPISHRHVTFVYEKGCLKKGLGHLEKASRLLSLDPYTAKFFPKFQSRSRYERSRNLWFGGYVVSAFITIIYPQVLKVFVDTDALTFEAKLLNSAVLVGLLLLSFLIAAIAKRKVDRFRSLKFLLDL